VCDDSFDVSVLPSSRYESISTPAYFDAVVSAAADSARDSKRERSWVKTRGATVGTDVAVSALPVDRRV
jgi:hypothetical protein